jgi:hypothetical protein
MYVYVRRKMEKIMAMVSYCGKMSLEYERARVSREQRARRRE